MMAGRQCKEMRDALKAYDKRKEGTSVRAIAAAMGVSPAGLYAAIARRKLKGNK